MADTDRAVRLASGALTFVYLTACLPQAAESEARLRDLNYDAQTYINQEYINRPECAPTVSPPVEIFTLLDAPGICPVSSYNDTPVPCQQIEHENGQRVFLAVGLAGMQAIESNPGPVRVAILAYPDTPSCISTDARRPYLIYVGPA